MRQLKISKQVTNRETPSLDKYLHEIGKVRLLSSEEEVLLAKKIKNGDEKALELLINANLRFVVSVAKQYQNQGMSLPDLTNEGNLGLIKAAQKFDETRGFKFISYAVWWIRQSIIQALAEQSRLVRLPINQSGTLSRLQKVSAKFEQVNGRTPSPEELSELTDIPLERLEASKKLQTCSVSLDTPFSEDDDNGLIDVISNYDSPSADSHLMDESLSREINCVLHTLSDREAEIIRRSFGIGCQELTIEEISDKFGVTRERVRQIKEKAIRRLKQASRNKSLKQYLG